MNKNTQNKNRKMSKLSSYLKVSCSALILSSSLVGYGFTKDAFAATQDAETATSETTTHVQKDLQDAMNKAKKDIKQLKHLSAVELKSYKEDIESAKNQNEIKDIIKEAKKENKVTAQENTTDVSNKDNSTESSSTQDASTEEEEKATTSNDTSADNTSNISNELDNIVSDLDTLSNKVDSGQQKDATTSNESSSSESNTSENTTDEVTKEEPTTEESPKEVPTTEKPSNQTTSSKSETSIVDKLDSIKNDIDSAKKDIESSKENDSNQLPSDENSTEEETTESSSIQDAPTTENTTHSNSNHHILDGLAKLNDTHKDQDLDTDARHHQFDKVNHQLSETEKINQAIAKIENSKDDASHLYINRKLDQLSDLRDNIQHQADLAKKDKQAIDNDIETVRKNIENNRDIILNRLQQVSDKQRAAEDVLNSVFSKNEAQHILKNIKTKGQSDKQIADQIMKQIDGLTSTTSDDILKSMLEQATNKEDLLKTILSTRLGQNEAATIAKRLANDHLTNSQIVDRLKQAFNQHGLVSSDDILNDILDKTSNRKQAIETMLATKLNQAKANALADIISRVQSDKANALDLVKSTINGKANDLLQLQNSLGQAKNRLNYILDPIVNRPSLLDRITGNTSGSNLGSNLLGNGLDLLGGLTGSHLLGNLPSGSSLLDGLTNGNSLLDGISDIPNPTQGLSLGHLGDDGLLSGLFNSDGNLSLPATGEAIKKNWIPIAAVIAITGGALVWFSRRKHHQSNN
ncbi:LPXTG cell wall anchor domain-containing protein [Staphylococcus hominis]|uniref:LPXTG cell wall anchor domain-containing protein n=1 Tax=Staphylococcus hominis TaxID=1290 RepID=UPI00019FC63D|nr:LPXTG cell wall anchor domain-containing protein [Staphylococcus hominis]EEK11979.1 LPXTG-motif cell wall anchor domain protein [Staphylococcus hominis SK119]MCI2839005.1 LPXTG cell wall anchor domain-containing protein [Staphylococcus hominis]MCI2854163.1 LPXTG cell wall anchor domain-containing protein [Staphylococcus hominis]MCI2890205.1 LPXTG cell wall anchor domain-containing protein [Staphylococcus hominis]MDS3855827.1 LPXTG cell wall anchor domain-containing protein [Staphylococcus h